MSDDYKLSLYLDGRLSPEQAAAFEQRLEADPALRSELEAMRRLQALSESLDLTTAGFSGDDVRLRARSRGGAGWMRLAAAAAAVLALALTHAGAFWWGAHRADEAEDASTRIEDTETLLRRASALDLAASPDRLEDELEELREAIDPNLISLAESDPRADTLREMRFALDQQSDPFVVGVTISGIANGEMRMVPTGARTYTRMIPIGEGRFRFIFIDARSGAPRGLSDEGTVAELQTRHSSFQFVMEK